MRVSAMTGQWWGGGSEMGWERERAALPLHLIGVICGAKVGRGRGGERTGRPSDAVGDGVGVLVVLVVLVCCRCCDLDVTGGEAETDNKRGEGEREGERRRGGAVKRAVSRPTCPNS